MATLRAALHEVRCAECRVTWRSWFLRLIRVGGMEPKVCICARLLPVGESPRPCPKHGWLGEGFATSPDLETGEQ